ncbi:MAG: sigma-70 family RNA polymerase sigma factor [Dokdonella sp.]|uniref:ECF-type sigma factor n=1 Tax=Dokdonella sp. TaxID=2291710 RepID=UPI0025C5416F|nr:ECF-type sigma factor [Dokdonella sp.]MBX3700218.1 sigma-70 family RNA polymerase sigma factor [Dokdonella sp.]
MTSPDDITRLLAASRLGDDGAAAQLAPLIYGELRRIAHSRLAASAADATLCTTALVHEAFLRLLGSKASFPDRGHFYAYAASAMRSIAVDHARRRQAQRRGGDHGAVMLDEHDDEHPGPDRVLALDQALRQLGACDARLCQLVEWRVFGGLALSEIAPLLGVTDRTLKRDWRKARALLAHLLETAPAPAP